MRFRVLAALTMTLGILAAGVGFAGPALATPDSWVMPNVLKMNLQKAIKAIEDVAGTNLNFRLIDGKNGQEIYNESNWVVCYSYPPAGGAISQEKKRVNLYAKRFQQKGCVANRPKLNT